MHEVVLEEVEALGPHAAAPPEAWRTVMERSFTRMDAEVVDGSGEPRLSACRCELQPPRSDHVGSTAVVAVVGPTQIVVGNCGDSRAVLCRNGSAVPLSIDHKVPGAEKKKENKVSFFFPYSYLRPDGICGKNWQPDREDELQRIEAAGGRVIYWDGARVLGVLAMSRAIGKLGVCFYASSNVG